MRNYPFTRLLLLFCLAGICTVEGATQLNNGGFHANFGVDADTKSDYIKYGSSTGNIRSDDWFSASQYGKGVIDTTGAFLYRSLLQANKNIAFSKRMAAPFFHKANGVMWLDAVYVRDYIKADSVNLDSTAYTSSCKNAQDPALWTAGPAGVSNKNDLLDVFTHMRRNGTSITDSLWLFTAASMVGTTGSKYYDVELFKNKVSYNAASGSFSSGGIDEGHTQWKFDAHGSVLQTGDLIIAVTYNPGTAPVIEVRLWVSRATYAAVRPQLFTFGTSFDADANNAQFGYATIVSRDGTTAFGSGVGNYASTSTDTTFSTPWGSTGKGWSADYQSLQLVEIGINLTRIGIDPALYTTLGANASCNSFFNSLLYKSRSSASFSSALNDFVGPVDFMNMPELDHDIVKDTLSCRKTSAKLQVVTHQTTGAYSWKDLSGATLPNASPDGLSLMVSAPGAYVLEATIASGCPAGRKDTVIVLTDTLKPVASIAVGNLLGGQFRLYGGDPVASNVLTPFGRSQGLAYQWSGPLQFVSTIQNPLAFSLGSYELTVTELRNGCTSTARSFADFSPLSSEVIPLQGKVKNGVVVLQWKHKTRMAKKFTIEKIIPAKGYQSIGEVVCTEKVEDSVSYFSDRFTASAQQTYRIKTQLADGRNVYSNEVVLRDKVTTLNKMYVHTESATGKNFLTVQSETSSKAAVEVYETSGKRVALMEISLGKGINNYELFSGSQKKLKGAFIVVLRPGNGESSSLKVIL